MNNVVFLQLVWQRLKNHQWSNTAELSETCEIHCWQANYQVLHLNTNGAYWWLYQLYISKMSLFHNIDFWHSFFSKKAFHCNNRSTLFPLFHVLIFKIGSVSLIFSYTMFLCSYLTVLQFYIWLRGSPLFKLFKNWLSKFLNERMLQIFIFQINAEKNQ